MKIVIIGNGGTGKSTLGNKLSKQLNIPVIHLDKFAWKENYERVPEEDFKNILEKLMRSNEMIIEGWAYQSTMKARLNWAEIIIYLKYPLEYCLRTVLNRNKEFNNKPYPYDVFTGDRVAQTTLYKEAVERVHYHYEPLVQKWLQKNEMSKKKLLIYKSIDELNMHSMDLLFDIKRIEQENKSRQL